MGLVILTKCTSRDAAMFSSLVHTAGLGNTAQKALAWCPILDLYAVDKVARNGSPISNTCNFDKNPEAHETHPYMYAVTQTTHVQFYS